MAKIINQKYQNRFTQTAFLGGFRRFLYYFGR